MDSLRLTHKELENIIYTPVTVEEEQVEWESFILFLRYRTIQENENTIHLPISYDVCIPKPEYMDYITPFRGVAVVAKRVKINENPSPFIEEYANFVMNFFSLPRVQEAYNVENAFRKYLKDNSFGLRMYAGIKYDSDKMKKALVTTQKFLKILFNNQRIVNPQEGEFILPSNFLNYVNEYENSAEKEAIYRQLSIDVFNPYFTEIAEELIDESSLLESEVLKAKIAFLSQIENPRLRNFTPLAPKLWGLNI